jgi:hypothetical protein
MRHAGSIVLIAFAMIWPSHAMAQRIENQLAVFAALDKVTARISRLEVKLGDTVKFGALKITPRTCYSRSATEQPKTTTFVEVTETQLDGKEKKIFAGWMFAESPGLNAVEHPVFDVWLTECGQPKALPAAAAAAATAKGQPTPKPQPGQPAVQQPVPAPAEDDQFRRRRPPR